MERGTKERWEKKKQNRVRVWRGGTQDMSATALTEMEPQLRAGLDAVLLRKRTPLAKKYNYAPLAAVLVPWYQMDAYLGNAQKAMRKVFYYFLHPLLQLSVGHPSCSS